MEQDCITGSSELVGIETRAGLDERHRRTVSPALRSWWGLKLDTETLRAKALLVSPALRSWWGLKQSREFSQVWFGGVSPALRSWWGLKLLKLLAQNFSVARITGSSELVGIETRHLETPT